MDNHRQPDSSSVSPLEDKVHQPVVFFACMPAKLDTFDVHFFKTMSFHSCKILPSRNGDWPFSGSGSVEMMSSLGRSVSESELGSRLSRLFII